AVVAESLKGGGWLAGASPELIDSAASVAVEKFDRALRELARRRQTEYEPRLAEAITGLVFDELLNHARAASAVQREPTLDDREQLIARGLAHGRRLMEVPRIEELDALLADMRGELVSRQILTARDDLLPDHPGVVTSSYHFVKRSLGGNV